MKILNLYKAYSILLEKNIHSFVQYLAIKQTLHLTLPIKYMKLKQNVSETYSRNLLD